MAIFDVYTSDLASRKWPLGLGRAYRLDFKSMKVTSNELVYRALLVFAGCVFAVALYMEAVKDQALASLDSGPDWVYFVTEPLLGTWPFYLLAAACLLFLGLWIPDAVNRRGKDLVSGTFLLLSGVSAGLMGLSISPEMQRYRESTEQYIRTSLIDIDLSPELKSIVLMVAALLLFALAIWCRKGMLCQAPDESMALAKEEPEDVVSRIRRLSPGQLKS